MSAGQKKDKLPLRGIVKYVYKKMGAAILDYNMLSEGDRILVGVSGGKDSLSLLKLFLMRKRRLPIDFSFIACFIESEFIKVDKDKVFYYCRDNGIPFISAALGINDDEVNCFWCSWNRRKLLFELAGEHGCNKVALGHNLDDITETIMMNLCFFGEISAMKPKLELFEGRLVVIRPLCYLTEEDIDKFARTVELPVADYQCLYGRNSRRRLIRKVVSLLEEDCPYVKKNIFRALKKIKQEYLV